MFVGFDEINCRTWKDMEKFLKSNVKPELMKKQVILHEI